MAQVRPYIPLVSYTLVFVEISILKNLHIFFVVWNVINRLVCLNKFVTVCIYGLKYMTLSTFHENLLFWLKPETTPFLTCTI